MKHLTVGRKKDELHVFYEVEPIEAEIVNDGNTEVWVKVEEVRSEE